MIKKILVPLDGTELAENALPYATELASKLGSKITAAYVAQTRNNGSKERSELYIADIDKRMGNEASLNSITLAGDLKKEISKYVNENNIGLVVLATQGQSESKRDWQIISKIIWSTKKPVIIIEPGKRNTKVIPNGLFKKILVPLDGSPESEAVLASVIEIASKLKSEVVLFSVLTKNMHEPVVALSVYMDYMEKRKEDLTILSMGYLNIVGYRLKEKGIKVTSEVRAGTPAVEITNYASEIGADLIAMSTSARSGIAGWFFKSNTVGKLIDQNTSLLIVQQ